MACNYRQENMFRIILKSCERYIDTLSFHGLLAQTASRISMDSRLPIAANGASI